MPTSSDPSTLTERIDQVCDRFEAEWRSGHRPELKDFSQLFAEEERLAVLCELQDIDDFWRRRSCESSPPNTSLIPKTRSLDDVETPVDEDTEAWDFRRSNRPSFPLRGQSLGGYELVDEIGRGGMGVVYQARQISTDRIVALKLIRSELLASLPVNTREVVLHRFRQEVQAAAKLEHDHIVTVYDGGEADGQPFLAMRFVRGESLGQTIRRHGPLAPALAARYIATVARAVEAAHQAGIVHRDIKPQNILIDKQNDRAMIADFGVAKIRTDNITTTQHGELLGTPGYMSPEQYQNAAAAGPQSDVYSLGATLYTALTGELPFRAHTPWELMRQVLEQAPPQPSSRISGIDSRLDAICLKCLQKEAEDRYITAGEFAEDLERYLQDESVLAAKLGVCGTTRKTSRLHWTFAASLVLVPVATFAAASVWDYASATRGEREQTSYGDPESVVTSVALHGQRVDGDDTCEVAQSIAEFTEEDANASPSAADWVSNEGIICWKNDGSEGDDAPLAADVKRVSGPSDEPSQSHRQTTPPGVQWDLPLDPIERALPVKSGG